MLPMTAFQVSELFLRSRMGEKFRSRVQSLNSCLVPLAGIEPALLAELDFESSASTNSATGAFHAQPKGRGREAGGI
jgi:hypothetical protein